MTLPRTILSMSLMLTGCSWFGLGTGNKPTTRTPDVAGRTYAGPACAEVLYPLDDRGRHDAPQTEDLRVAVLLEVCHRARATSSSGHTEEQDPRFDAPWMVARHQAFDDRRNDPLEAALLVVECGTAEHCVDDVRDAGGQADPTSIAAGHANAGMLAVYADMVELDGLRARLGAVGVDELAAGAFVQRFEATAADMRARVAALSPEQRAFVYDGPRALWQARQQDYAEHHERWAALDALAARGADDDGVAAELEALRSAYAAGCGAPSCRHDLFYLGATQALLLHHVARGDALGVVLEAPLFDAPEARALDWDAALYRLQSEREREAAAARERHAKAERNGVRGAARKQVVGDAAPLWVLSNAIWPHAEAVDYRELVDAKGVAQIADEVRSAKQVGAVVKVTFTVKKHEVQEPYGCRRTGRLERIHGDGRLEYEEHCKYRTRTITDPVRPPVSVPAHEGAGLRAGEHVRLFGLGEQTRVGSVTRDGDVVQWRGDRFGKRS